MHPDPPRASPRGRRLAAALKRIFRDFRERSLTAENTENAEENRQGVAERKGRNAEENRGAE